MKQRLPLHGRDHRRGGSDPIPNDGEIRFDTYPQAGNWLYVETDDAAAAGGSPNGYGIELNDNSTGGAFMGAFGGGDVHLRATGGGQIYLQSAGDISLAATNLLRLGTLGDVLVTASGNISLEAQGGYFSAADQGNYVVKVGTQDGADYSFQIVDAGNAAVLKVKWNSGTSTWQYHAKTGGAWVFDL